MRSLRADVEQGFWSQLRCAFLLQQSSVDLEPMRGYPPYEELLRPKG